MPCTVSPAEAAFYEKEANERKYGEHTSSLDIATRVACELMRELERTWDQEAMITNWEDMSPLVQRWVEVHKAADEEREQRERTEELAEKRRQRALAKLTDKDKEALLLVWRAHAWWKGL
jgi:hypothetical protein